ncbi:MAG: hypothetical protein A2X77_03890 [Gammaproteobacteria bacterium GWE2_42_36]|nr:MAG: hypothetical protein A2X77_03890 [Gammaproteobacteria bacterium GWE2_42_36]HCU05702.1 hypothetical protein [Coxiellaceae bacterium]
MEVTSPPENLIFIGLARRAARVIPEKSGTPVFYHSQAIDDDKKFADPLLQKQERSIVRKFLFYALIIAQKNKKALGK